jgi:POT family proton-dependent oligopeptide transporter
MFAGFLLTTLALLYAAILQHFIYSTSPCGSYASPSPNCKSPINVSVQTPIYILLAASAIMISVSTLEYAFTKAPRNMRSLVQAFAISMTAVAAALGEAFKPLSENPRLVWNNAVMAGLALWLGAPFGGCTAMPTRWRIG